MFTIQESVFIQAVRSSLLPSEHNKWPCLFETYVCVTGGNVFPVDDDPSGGLFDPWATGAIRLSHTRDPDSVESLGTERAGGLWSRAKSAERHPAATLARTGSADRSAHQVERRCVDHREPFTPSPALSGPVPVWLSERTTTRDGPTRFRTTVGMPVEADSLGDQRDDDARQRMQRDRNEPLGVRDLAGQQDPSDGSRLLI